MEQVVEVADHRGSARRGLIRRRRIQAGDRPQHRGQHAVLQAAGQRLGDKQLFVDWLEFSGAELDPSDSQQVAATAAVELEASRRDPYRQLSRVFHLVGRKGPN